MQLAKRTVKQRFEESELQSTLPVEYSAENKYHIEMMRWTPLNLGMPRSHFCIPRLLLRCSPLAQI